MERTIDFGVVKYDAHEKPAKVTVELELKEDKQGRPVFSCCAYVWNRRHNDIIMGGQCLDRLHIDNVLFFTIKDLWHKHHLNDMHDEPKGNTDPFLRGMAWYYWPIPEVDLYQIKRIIETGHL